MVWSPCLFLPLNAKSLFAEKTRGVENFGEGKTYHKTPPQKRFWTHPYDTSPPPPVCSHPVIFLRGNVHRPDESHSLLYSTFSPPQNCYVLPPPFAISNLSKKSIPFKCPKNSPFVLCLIHRDPRKCQTDWGILGAES